MKAVYFGLLATVVAVCLPCSPGRAEDKKRSANASDVEIAERLTVEQTLGAVFGAIRATPFEQFARSNPKALEAIYKVLDNPRHKAFHRNCILVIGFTGQERDVQLLESHISSLTMKELSISDCAVLESIPDALALMVRRDVKGADEKVREMLTRSYWDQFSFNKYPKLPANAKDVSAELVAVTVRATALVDVDYAKLAYETSIAKESDAVVSDFYKRRSTPQMLGENAKAANERISRKIPAETLLALKVLSNGDIDDPEPNSSFDDDYRALVAKSKEDPTDLRQGMSRNEQHGHIQAAAQQFEKIIEAIALGREEEVWNRVFDLSQQVPRSAPASEKRAVSVTLGKLKGTAVAIKDIELGTGDADVSVKSIRDAVTKKQVKVIEVKIPIPRSRDTFLREFADGNGPTIDRKGQQLVVLMRKVGDDWYWHPFGW